jgi:hypothetical protein
MPTCRPAHLSGLLCLAFAAATLPRPASAADEEIQVYLDEMDDPGQFGLDVHNNYVPVGNLTHDYPGEQQSLGRYRVTPEFSYGLTKYLEAGLYLPLATIDRYGHADADGIKGRLKFIAPHPEDQTWFWGLNFEIGAVGNNLDENPGNAELKGILGDRIGPWTLGLNANIDFKVAGPVASPTTVEFDSKISYKLTDKFAIGLESYNGSGELQHFGSLGHSPEAIFAVVDTSIGAWDLNFGVGAGYGASTDHLILKAIVSVPIDN